MSAPIYLIVLALFKNELISQDNFLLLLPLVYLVVLSFSHIWSRALPNHPLPVSKWLTGVSDKPVFWKAVLVFYILSVAGGIVIGALIWIDRGILNAEPIITDVVVTYPRLKPGKSTPLLVTATDPDEDELTYNWTLSNGGSMERLNKNMLMYHAPEASGTCEIVLTVSDGKGKSASRKVKIEVVRD